MGKFGGRGPIQGDAAHDLMGAVRRSPNGEYLAIQWPSPPHPSTWWVVDYAGSVGYETPERVAHWPVIGAVPGSPAAGMGLMPHPQGKRQAPRDTGRVCANPDCGHTDAEHHGGITGHRCSGAACACPRFYAEAPRPAPPIEAHALAGGVRRG